MTLIMVGCSKTDSDIPDGPPQTTPVIDTTPTENPVTPTETPEPTDLSVVCVTETNWDAPTHYMCARRCLFCRTNW